jgi:hypothetical protein
MVLFSACNTYHRVMPSERDSSRLCLSLMFYGNDNRETSPLIGTNSGIQYSMSFPNALSTKNDIMDPTVLLRLRSVLTPLLYFEDFRSSLRDAFSDSSLTNAPTSSSSDEVTSSGLVGDETHLAVERAVDYFVFKCQRAVREDPVTKAAMAQYLFCFPDHANRISPLLLPAPPPGR